MCKRLGILLLLATVSNDSFWEIMRLINGIKEFNAYIYLIEIVISMVYFILVSYWDNNIRYFTEFKERCPTIYKCIFQVFVGINYLVVYFLFFINVVMIVFSVQSGNEREYLNKEKENAKKQLEKHKELVGTKQKHYLVIGFSLAVCAVILWLLMQYKVINESILKYIACICNVLIMIISVIFIVKNYSEE